MSDYNLDDYQQFIVQKKFVKEKQAPYYMNWVKKFLLFSKKNQRLNSEDMVAAFTSQLTEDLNVEEWQEWQAVKAVKIYMYNYMSEGRAEKEIQNSKVPDDKVETILSLMRESLRFRHYSYRTEQSYLEWVKRFYYYMDRTKEGNYSRLTVTSDDIRNYLTYLTLTRKVAASTQNQAFNALLFLCRSILQIELHDMAKTVRAKRAPKLPVVLSQEEVMTLFQHVKVNYLLMVKILYGTGMRLMELTRLRVKDVDFSSDLIFVRSGKGDKDRTTMLPKSIRTELQEHLKTVKEIHDKDLRRGVGEVYLPQALAKKYPQAGKEWGWQYIFPAFDVSTDPRSDVIRRHHIGEKGIQNAMKKAVKKAGIVKPATVHTLRHSFATHLLMTGVDIRKIQGYLGYKSVETTMIYTHVVRDLSPDAESPLDMIMSMSSS